MRSSSVLSPECSRLKKGLFFFSRVENVLHRNTFKIRDLSAPNNDSARLKQRKTGRTKAQRYREDFLQRPSPPQLNERHASKLHLVAPPNISMLLSAQEKTFPAGALLVQVAKFLISAPESFRFHMFKFASSPTYACVASKPPPSVSCGERRRYCWRYVGRLTRREGRIGLTSSDLLLAQDQHPLWFDGVIWCQVLPAAPHHAVLKGFPHPISGCPCDAEVMPLPIVDEERELCHLQQG